jgi:hypothetical protein
MVSTPTWRPPSVAPPPAIRCLGGKSPPTSRSRPLPKHDHSQSDSTSAPPHPNIPLINSQRTSSNSLPPVPWGVPGTLSSVHPARHPPAQSHPTHAPPLLQCHRHPKRCQHGTPVRGTVLVSITVHSQCFTCNYRFPIVQNHSAHFLLSAFTFCVFDNGIWCYIAVHARECNIACTKGNVCTRKRACT